jgi:hypothetical protein
LESIRKDNFARSIFHFKHTLKSDNLRNGFETLRKRSGLFTQEKYEDDIAQYRREHTADVVVDDREIDEAQLYS